MFQMSPFNQPLNSWDVSNVQSMCWMFLETPFDHPLDSWNLSSIERVDMMFSHSPFSHSLQSWMPYLHAKGIKMDRLFCYNNDLFKEREEQEPSPFSIKTPLRPKSKEELIWLCKNKEIHLGDIDTSLITDMSYLFYSSDRDRRDFSGIEKWDTSNVVDMSYMFYDCMYFNHPLDSWDVSNVENMDGMFYDSPFNHPLDSWDVSGVEMMDGMFTSCPYSHSLESWGDKNPFKQDK